MIVKHRRAALGVALLSALALTGPRFLQAQQAGVNLEYNPQANTENLAPFGANVISPEVHDDRSVTFRVNAPDAQEVLLTSGQIQLALDSGREPIPFTKGEDGVWTLTVGPIEPDIYTYKLSIDGVAVADPNNTFAAISVQPPQSLLVVHGDGPAYYDPREVPHGAVTQHIYHSDVLDGEREMYVYTPPDYDPSREYPVLYLVGGSGESAPNWVTMGRANFIMDNLLAEGRVEPMLIAMPNNQVVHRRHPKHVELTFDLFEQELVEHIIPVVEQNYSVQSDRRGRALSGLSMGGRHTQFVGFKNLDLFASFGVLSAGSVESETDSAEFLNDPEINEKVDYLFVGQGTHEAQPGNRTEALHTALENHGIEHEYYVGGNGAHDWSTWRHLLHEKFLPGLWRADAADQSTYDYRLLATNKTSTMEKEMNEAADAGYTFGGVMGGETSFGGKEVVVIMVRSSSPAKRTVYRLLATNRTSTMQRELQQAGDEGFEYCGQTIFSSTFGGREVAIILGRDPDAPPRRIEYRLLATNKTATMQKELVEAGQSGFELLGMGVGATSLGGNEVLAVLARSPE